MAYYDLAVIFYIIAFLFLLISFYFNKPILRTMQIIFTLLAVIANAIELFTDLKTAQTFSSFALKDFLMLTSLCLGILYLIVSAKLKKSFIGFFIFPLIIGCGMVSLFLSPEPSYSMALENIWLYVHVPLAVIGTSFFVVSFGAGIMYFIMEKQLKEKRFGRIFDSFPSLYTIDKINNASMFLGFSFYSAGMLAAAGWLRFHYYSYINTPELLTSYKSFMIKIGLSIFAWFVFSIILIIKMRHNISPRQTALASIIGFLSVIIIYTGVVMFVVR